MCHCPIRPSDPINLSDVFHLGVRTCCQRLGRYTQLTRIVHTATDDWSFFSTSWCTDYLECILSWPCPRSHDNCQTLSRDLWATCGKCSFAWAWLDRESGFLKCPCIIEKCRRHVGTPYSAFCHRKIGQIRGCVQNLRIPKINQNVQQYFTQENQWSGYWWYSLLNFEHKKPLNGCLNLLLLPNLVSLAPSGSREPYLWWILKVGVPQSSPWVSIVSHGPNPRDWGNLHVHHLQVHPWWIEVNTSPEVACK